MKKFLTAATLLLISAVLFAQTTTFPLPDSSQIPDTTATEQVVMIPDSVEVDVEVADSTAWQELSMQGKLSMDGLPVSPAVKIYMKRGETVILSARAPIFGEVVRMEVCPDSATFINKHAKKYWSHDIRDAVRKHPGIITDLQELLLGNLYIPGHGPLTPELRECCQLSETGDGNLFLFPGPDMQYRGLEYGFVVSPDDLALQTLAVLIPDHDAVFCLDYLFGEQGWTLGLGVDAGKNNLEGSLQLSYPDYHPTPLTLTNAGAKYTRTDFKRLLKF